MWPRHAKRSRPCTTSCRRSRSAPRRTIASTRRPSALSPRRSTPWRRSWRRRIGPSTRRLMQSPRRWRARPTRRRWCRSSPLTSQRSLPRSSPVSLGERAPPRPRPMRSQSQQAARRSSARGRLHQRRHRVSHRASSSTSSPPSSPSPSASPRPPPPRRTRPPSSPECACSAFHELGWTRFQARSRSWSTFSTLTLQLARVSSIPNSVLIELRRGSCRANVGR
mmetsp:Transcript_62084/g.192321  ORF Transcript_62084/g.192321 Transcript_62084/m.192321 type:complete len:223 (+) Transcript_62084:1662-2330(+)